MVSLFLINDVFCWFSSLECHFRHFAAAFFGFEVGGLLKPEDGGEDVERELADGGVVLAHGFVELPAFHGDAVLRPLQLGLQFLEVFVGFQFRVVLGDGKQPPEGASHFALRFLVGLQLFGREVVHGDGHLRGFASGFRHGLEGFLLVRSVALHGVHQVGDEVGASLVLVFHVAPCVFHAFFLAHEAVVGRHACDDEQHDGGKDDDG